MNRYPLLFDDLHLVDDIQVSYAPASDTDAQEREFEARQLAAQRSQVASGFSLDLIGSADLFDKSYPC